MALLRIFVIAISLGLDVFAVGIGVGMRGVPTAVKWRIGVSFAAAEISMNLIGAALGATAGKLIGSVAGYLGFIALIAVGIFMIVEALRETESSKAIDMTRGWGLLVASLSISLDSLGIGFSILYIGVPLYTALAVIGAVSVLSTFLGISFGRLLGRRVEERAELLAGIVLAATGSFFILQRVMHW